MIREGEAGIDCAHCGYKKAVETESEASAVEKILEWRFGSPLCPRCGQSVVFEDYIPEPHELNGSNPNPPECDPRC